MAYPDPFNLATPADTDLRGQGDDRIRELKRALDQRFGTVFTGMDVDPLTFIAGIIPGAAIANGAINLARMAAGSVDTAQLLDASVTACSCSQLRSYERSVHSEAGERRWRTWES
jgi:hypothetical protein